MKWVEDLNRWIFDPKNADQEKEGKTKFLQSPAYGPPTDLKAVGISNAVLKKKSAKFYKNNKTISFSELITGINNIWMDSGISEAHVLCYYILSRYKKYYDDELWELIDKNWVPKIDHWISSDHLCMEIYGHYPVYRPPYLSKIQTWVKSVNPWRRRIGVTCLLQHVRKNPNAAKIAIQQIATVKNDSNYCVRKSIPWILREASKSDLNGVEEYIRNNIAYFNKTELREASKRMSDQVQEELLVVYDRMKK
jgi:3-methyladenine DNA glycosylase AlkD